jgi:hypothetical protein
MPAMTVAELEAAELKRELIFKPLEAHVFGASMTAVPVQYITEGATGGLAELPEDWFDFGLLFKDDAIALSRAMETSDINAVGFRDPVRSDTTSDQFSMTFSGLEINRHNLEYNLNVDLSTHKPQAVTGEVAFDQPTASRAKRGRFLTIARDGSGADTIFVGRQFYAGEVTETGEGALMWPITVGSRIDTNFAASVRHFFGGPGLRSRLSEAGFLAMTTTP